mgnify:CR=1 FL=1
MKQNRINFLLKKTYIKNFVVKDIFKIAAIEHKNNLDEERLLEKAYYRSFYKTSNVILRLDYFNNLIKLKTIGQNRHSSFCKAIFSSSYSASFRHKKGEQIIRKRIFNSYSNNQQVYFEFTNFSAINMFFNMESLQVKNILKRLDVINDLNASSVVQERLNKQVFTQSIEYVIPQYISFHSRRFSSNQIRPILEHLNTLTNKAFLGYNCNLINVCFIINVYFYVFLISIIFQIIQFLVFLVEQLYITKNNNNN